MPREAPMISKRVFHELKIVIVGFPDRDNTPPPTLAGAVTCFVDGSWALQLDDEEPITGDRDSGGREAVSTILRRVVAAPVVG